MAVKSAVDDLRSKLDAIVGGSDETVTNLDLARALVDLNEHVDEVHARVKKSNSLVGMLVGRMPAKKGGAK